MSETANYLDVTKSVIISSPAGSGKTEKLARRYVSLLESGSEVEKILCITFTEKAAAEMKERILSIIEREYPDLFSEIREKIPVMRISTIHAFCLKILKRFCIELGLDPSVDVSDELTAQNLWTETLYESLMAERENPSHFFRMIKDRGIRGWSSLKRLLDTLHSKEPYPSMLLNMGLESDDETGKLLNVYRECLTRYNRKKRDRHLLDYNDLEMFAYEALSLGAESHNILYSFDEHTDHLLVDEFQDTNALQWSIIDKLTEEWRAGMGAKREKGTSPTIFIVGDEKQSIYLFRGANAGVFREARQRFDEWLGDEHHFIEVKDNYRSLPAIVNFTNSLFEKLMPQDSAERWRTRYAPFQATREGTGKVELLLLEGDEGTRNTRAREARALARTVKKHYKRYEIHGGDNKRTATYGDMAVLIRRRTHLDLFEDAFREEGVPFVVLKGIGFYEEPETAVLRELISFIVDPSDDYSLFCVLRSPLFGLPYKTLYGLLKGKRPLMDRLRISRQKHLSEIASTLDSWLERSATTPLAELLEQVFRNTGGWLRYWEPQRHANIRKFISLVESLEETGLSGIEIREKFLRQRFAEKVSKANINAEGINAVKIMTIHAAKGLQFPMVFLPSLDENAESKSMPIVIDDSEGKLALHFEEDPKKRGKNEHFVLQKLKEKEEEKRLFYVAVTRAEDYLCMIGSHNERKLSGRLSYLGEAYDLFSKDGPALPFEIISEEDLSGAQKHAGVQLTDDRGFVDMPAFTEPLDFRPRKVWVDVTKDLEILKKHGEHGVLIGTVMHRLLDELSRGTTSPDRVQERANALLRLESSGEESILDFIMEDMGKLKSSGLLDEIVLPRDNSHSEFPVVLEKGDRIYSGRIDRLILEVKEARIYDYKTFPVRAREIPDLIRTYRFQMNTYREAVEKIFSRKTTAYLIFTHMPEVVEV